MRISDISVPEIYKTSADFRFFLKWFETALTKIHYDTENLPDIYDPLRCPSWLLWMLGDTMGYKYDTRLPAAFNRAVLVYFMSMIRNRGSKDGVTLAAEVNLKQFDINTVAGIGYENSEGEYVEPKDILYNRLEDTSIPVNSAVVTPHTPEGYIDVTYFSDELPIDACIEYVRPLGMYIFQHAGVRFDGRTKLSIDARLTNTNEIGMSIGPTHVGHYSREDYARLQRIEVPDDLSKEGKESPAYKLGHIKDGVFGLTREEREGKQREDTLSDRRRNVWYRNSEYEGSIEPIQGPSDEINPGYRALYSLQLCNNEHIVRSLVPAKPGLKSRNGIFGLGWEPQDVSWTPDEDYVLPDVEYDVVISSGRIRPWNLRYDKTQDEEYFAVDGAMDITTIDENRTADIVNPRPAVNPVMHVLGDAMSTDDSTNERYQVAVDSSGNYPIPRQDPDSTELNDGKLIEKDVPLE